MPYLCLHTNAAVEDADALADALGKLAAQLLGKSERFVMVEVVRPEAMRFAGTDEPCALLDFRSLGLAEEATRDLSAQLCAFLEERLGVPKARIYIAFASPARAFWGWNGGTF